MKQRILFEDEPTDYDLEKALPDIMAKAVELKDDVFVYYNGVTLRVCQNDNVDDLMVAYEDKLKRQRKGEELIAAAESLKESDCCEKHLYHVHNRLGDFYIVARSFDEAKREMLKRLDEDKYGFSSYRKVQSIHDMACQKINRNRQSFSDDDGNLIIVGDILR